MKKSRKKQKKKPLAVPKTPRNFVAQNLLLKKGGVHQKTNKALRAGQKQSLRSTLRKDYSSNSSLLQRDPLLAA